MKKKLMDLLIALNMVDKDYTGQVIIHFNRGSIVTYDNYIKGSKLG